MGGLSVFGVLDSQVGAEVYNSTKQRMYQYFRHADVDQAGKSDEQKKPIDYYFTVYNGNNPTESFVEDATYLKLRELSVQYQLSPRRFRFLRGVGADRDHRAGGPEPVHLDQLHRVRPRGSAATACSSGGQLRLPELPDRYRPDRVQLLASTQQERAAMRNKG